MFSSIFYSISVNKSRTKSRLTFRPAFFGRKLPYYRVFFLLASFFNSNGQNSNGQQHVIESNLRLLLPWGVTISDHFSYTFVFQSVNT